MHTESDKTVSDMLLFHFSPEGIIPGRFKVYLFLVLSLLPVPALPVTNYAGNPWNPSGFYDNGTIELQVPRLSQTNCEKIELQKGWFISALAQRGGYLSDDEAMTAISIQNPWWKEGWAIIFYLFIVLGITLAWRRNILPGLKLRNSIRIANNVNGKLRKPAVLSSQIFVDSPEEIPVSSRDSHFMKKLLAVVERNMDNSDFSVEELSRELSMSRSQIHRKLKAILNMSARNYIRSVRMHKAMELIRKDAGTISEIAYMVGYDDPGYFSKTFRAFFGILPSAVRKTITYRRHTDSI
jgi:AraC-like DNA-binding protein